MTAGPGSPPPQQPQQPQQPPYGRPPYGYAPAPPVAGPPPEPAERPLTVRAGLGAFVTAILLSLASTVFLLADWDTYLRRAVAEQASAGGVDPAAAEFAQATAEVLAVAVAVIGVLFAALQLLFVWFAWTGRNWARIVLWVFGGLGVVSGIGGLAAGAALPSMTVLGVFQTLALVAGAVLLALGPSNDWFRSEKWRRAVTVPR